MDAHDTHLELSAHDASVADEFFRAVVEYVYVGPERVKAYQTRLGSFAKTEESIESTPEARRTERIN
jgi:hypothetical protein